MAEEREEGEWKLSGGEVGEWRRPPAAEGDGGGELVRS